MLAAAVAAALVALAVWPSLAERSLPPVPDRTWAELAPPPEVRLATWRWLVVSGVAHEAHLRISASHDDVARLELLPAWHLQRPVPGYPADALVVAIGGGETAALERRTAALAAELLRGIPTLAIARLGTDRLGAPPGLDQERLRYLVRERTGR